jgi:malonyl-CoA/methylmalonyl-CoA synthetase
VVADESISIVGRAGEFAARTALLAADGRFTYGQLLDLSANAASWLLDGSIDLQEARIAFLIRPSMAHVQTQWGIWRSGGMAVPLCVDHPAPELEYVLDDSQASIVVADPEFESLLRPLAERRGLRFGLAAELMGATAAQLPEIDARRRAMLVYTSGTTSKPKGTVYTHTMIEAQVTSLVEAWRWTNEDHLIHVLPLHHVHGIINALCCALWSGATCQLLPRFDADKVWERLAARDGITLFMAVPTIYSRLIKVWQEAGPERRENMTDGCRALRVMISGSAALPVATLETWRQISGHTLLERYGMTEIGMALSNPLNDERRPGCVGAPLPRVQVRLVDEEDRPLGDGSPGQIQVQGPMVFSEYWQRPEATSEAFAEEGWFRTGDVAVREDGVYRILGRESVDIIKTGGYKVSALEIEEVLRTHEDIEECAVVGIADEEWGQRVAAAVVISGDGELELEPLRTWCKKLLAPYKVPSILQTVSELPRNSMGKVTKPTVVELFKGR